MAIAAVDAVARDVPLVAELNRLLARDVRLGHPRRAIDCAEQPAEAGDEEHRAKDADASNRVGGTMKDLRHRSKRDGRQRRHAMPTSLTRAGRRNRPSLLQFRTPVSGFYNVKRFTQCQKRPPAELDRSVLHDLLRGRHEPPLAAPGSGGFSQTYAPPPTYFANHSSSALALKTRCRGSVH